MKFLKQPQALFGLPVADFTARQQLEGYVKQAAAGIRTGNWDQNLIELLEYLPQVLTHIPDDVEIPPEAFRVLSLHPYVIYQSYLKDGNAQLEMVLQLSAEYSYYLLKRTLLPPAQRPYRTTSQLQEAVLGDPNWALRWCLERKDKAFYTRLLQYLEGTKTVNACSSLAYHRLIAGKLSKDDAFLDIRSRIPQFAKEPRVAVWVAENYPEVDRKLLYRNCIAGDPPYMLYWAKHFPGDQDAFIKREIGAFPAWVPDYIKMFKPDDSAKMLSNAMDRCSNPWIQGWLEIFGRTNGLL